jgi:hypothetical protein
MGWIYPVVRTCNCFDKSVEDMLTPLLELFDVTFTRTYIKGRSELLYFFLKPEQDIKDSFGFEREILCIYFDYSGIDTRLFDAINKILFQYKSRLDQMVCVFITNSTFQVFLHNIKQFL